MFTHFFAEYNCLPGEAGKKRITKLSIAPGVAVPPFRPFSDQLAAFFGQFEGRKFPDSFPSKNSSFPPG